MTSKLELNNLISCKYEIQVLKCEAVNLKLSSAEKIPRHFLRASKNNFSKRVLTLVRVFRGFSRTVIGKLQMSKA